MYSYLYDFQENEFSYYKSWLCVSDNKIDQHFIEDVTRPLNFRQLFINVYKAH